MKITQMTTNHQRTPLGIDAQPYFSWKMTSDLPNTLQTAYALSVTDESGCVVWETGKVETRRAAYIAYAGTALQSRTRYSWTVTVWDNHGNNDSDSSWFETALLSPADWSAQWVRTARPYVARKKEYGEQPPATMFRRSFTIDTLPVRARLYATCQGVYRLSVNGQRPDFRELAPEHTSYRKLHYYQSYDLLPQLRVGENVLGMYVGDGWFCCPQTQPPIDGLEPDHAVLFQLELQYADGNRELIVSDPQTLHSEGGVRFSDLFYGEGYDANLAQTGWDRPGFDAAAWQPSLPLEWDMSILQPQYVQPVTVARLLPAREIYTSCKGEMIVDFGQVVAGRSRIRIDVPAGTVVTLEHFESPDADGSYYNSVQSAMGNMLQKETYISNGKPTVYEAMFTFHGFRYLRVTGLPNAKPEDFTAVALSTDKPNAGTFRCSNGKLNRLYENTRWSQSGNMISIPTDCPQREKAGWTGDISIYAKTALLNEDVTPFLTSWLRSLVCDQDANGSVPFVVPNTSIYYYSGIQMGPAMGCNGPVCSAGWGDAAVTVPWDMYELTGNDTILKAQYPSMKAWCDYILERAKVRRPGSTLPDEVEQWLWDTGFQFGEWKIPSLEKGDVQGDIHEIMALSALYTAPLFAWRCIDMMARTAALLGNEADAAYYSDAAAHMKQAIADGLIDENGNMPTERQGAYLLMIAFGLVPEQWQQHFADRLAQLIHDNGDCLDTGFLGTPYLLDALCMSGNRDLAYTLLYQENSPSWLAQINAGATTIWEGWEMYLPNGTPKNESFNHYAYGCVDDWMFRYINGIRQEGVGYRHIVLQPQPDESLTWAERSFETEQGLLSCYWERCDGCFNLKAEIPCNSTATIILPDGSQYEVGSGKHTFCCAE